MTKMTNPIPEATIVRIVQSYYDAVDSLDADRISGGLYLPEPSTTQFNADSPIVSVEAIKAFSARFTQAVAGVKHSMIEIWTNEGRCRARGPDLRDPAPLSPWYLLPFQPSPFATLR